MSDRRFSDGEKFEYKGEEVTVTGYSRKLNAYKVDYLGANHFVSESTLRYLEELKNT